MGILSTIGIRWAKLRFRHQLAISHTGVLLFALLLVTTTTVLMSKQIYLDRGYDLLTITNNRSFERLQQEALAVKGDLSSALGLAKIFTDRTGLGESGETYLIYADGRLLTESRFLKNPGPAPIPINLGERWVGIKKDYRGISVLAVWQRVAFTDFQGYLASEIDEAEVLAPVRQMATAASGITILVLALLSMLVPFLARVLSRNTERFLELERVRGLAVLQGQEQERHRISQELHDDIGQQMTVLALKLATSDLPKAETELLINEVNSISRHIKGVSENLSTTVLRTLGFYQSVRSNLTEIKDIARKQNLDFQFDILGDEEEFKKMGFDRALAAYRIVQEATNNMLKHSLASKGQCSIELSSGALKISVEDNGSGVQDYLQVDQKGSGGLTSMRARAETYGGNFSFNASRGRGVKLDITIPLESKL